MPSTGWLPLSAVDADQEYLVLLTYLPLKHWSRLTTFLRYVLAIQKQLKTAKGIIGYSLLAHLFIPTCTPSGNSQVEKVRHGTEAFRIVSQMDKAVAQGLFDLIKRFVGSIGHGVLA